jgi:cellulose synthase/poly-beta-1,6-N-acetylglucosamine synthase-like glycosyltransferase
MPSLAFLLGLVVLAFEFQNLVSWWSGWVLRPIERPFHDFTIVVPLFGDPRYFEERRSLERYRERVLVAVEVTPPAMRLFADRLESEGWGVSRVQMADPNPARLLAAALEDVTTTYVLRLDADTSVGDDIPGAVAAVAADGADLASIKVDVLEPRGMAARLQRLEYRIAMLTRHYRPWLTSGACFIARTSSLRRIFSHHSKWTPGEDIETGRAAVALRMRVRHADISVQTQVPERWRELFRQRRLWWAGSFRHGVVNLDRNVVQMPLMTTYWTLMIWLSVALEPWHVLQLGATVSMIPLLYVSYLIVTVVPNLRVLSPWMLVFPLYAFVQSLVMPLVGAIHYWVLARRKGTLGRYRFPLMRPRVREASP